MRRIYLDHAATTPLLPEAAEAMRPWLENRFGNPSSLHEEGRHARAAVDEARETISDSLGCEFGEVLFTSGGTEAANLAILGLALANRDGSRNRILMSAGEHHCVLHTRPILEKLGFEVETVAIDRAARLDLEDLRTKLDERTLLLCLMHASNELGTIQPAREAFGLASEKGAFAFCDAVQTFCSEVPWTVEELGADLVSVSAHKVYGPKGVGALYVRAGVKLQPLAVGGGQEREVRAGTENVAGIVGFAAAVRSVGGASSSRPPLPSASSTSHLPIPKRDFFYAELGAAGAPEWVRSVPSEVPCLAGHAHIRFPGASAESMLILLDRMGLSASSGAACSSGSLEPSHVLLAAGCTETEAKEGLRFSFGRTTTREDAREAANRVAAAAKRVLGER
jgi:cysteine desulfurase